jgi:hypothetical protein
MPLFSILFDEDLCNLFKVFLGSHVCALACTSSSLRRIYKQEAERWSEFTRYRSSFLSELGVLCMTKWKKVTLVLSVGPNKKPELIDITNSSDFEVEVAKLARQNQAPFRIGIQFDFLFLLQSVQKRFFCMYVAK